jgi:hypothetical protein
LFCSRPAANLFAGELQGARQGSVKPLRDMKSAFITLLPPLTLLQRFRGVPGRLRLALAAFLLLAAAAARASEVPAHNISAANLIVVQNDANNTEASVTVTNGLTINDMRVRTGSNRGDYTLQVGDNPYTNYLQGLILTATSQNLRYNLDESSDAVFGISAFDGTTNGYWVVMQDVTSDRAECNINCAVAYFRYTNWLCGWARNKNASNGATNNLLTSSPGITLGNQFKGIGNGESRVDLSSFGFSTNSGVLLVNHAKNEGNFALSRANADGTWELYVKDNYGNETNAFSLEQDPVAFVFIPKTNTTVVSGKFGLDDTGTNATILLYSGNSPAFAITNFSPGQYRLTIAGQSPASGILITSPEGGYTNNFDNIVTYEADGDGWIIQSRDTGVYPPALEACTNEPVASFVFIPAATPGFTRTPATSPLVTTERGGIATFTLQLDTAPTNDVVIPVSSSKPAEGMVSPDTITFTPDNWNVPQTITITGQDDALADGSVAYTVVLGPAVSGDVNYNGLDPADVAALNIDDELPGITVTPTNGLMTTESGGTATFYIFLNKAPAADVTIGLTSSLLTEGTVAPASLTFTADNWSTPQAVTVTGVDDYRQDGPATFSIVTAPAVSADPNYSSLNAADVSVKNVDNDAAAFLWSYAEPLSVLEGGTATYSLKLATQPDANVVLKATSSASVTLSPATVTFTPADWSTAKIIAVTGSDNTVTNADVTFYITNTLSTADPVYKTLTTNIVILGSLIDNELKLQLPSDDCLYGLGMAPVGLDGQGAIVDVLATSFANSELIVTLTSNASSSDVLAIRSTGNETGQISVSGSEINYQGLPFATFSGGGSLNPLVVSLGSATTLEALQKLIRNITFATASNGASLLPRNAQVRWTNSTGLTALADKTIRVGNLRLTQYQEGADYGYGIYQGAADIALSEAASTTPWPEGRNKAPVEGLLIDWPDGGVANESQVLLRFDNFVGTNYWQVPSNAIVVSAELLLTINNTGDGGRFFRMLVPWDATNDTWSSLGEGVDHDDVEASSVYQSQLGVEDGSGATGTGTVSVGVTPDVQAWVNGTNNYGWVMVGWPLRTDGTGFSPSEYEVVSERPRLRVYWLLPQYTEVSFRQGANNYVSAHDANIRQATNTTSYPADESLWCDAPDNSTATNATECLLRFDDIIGTAAGQIPPGARIQAAMLELCGVVNNAMGDGGQICALLKSWDENTTTWDSWSGGVQADGVKAAATPTAIAGNASLNPDVQGTINAFNVTSDVQAWVDGTRPNYGWAFIPWSGGANGWGFASSEYYSYLDINHPELERPRLRVWYSAAATVAAARLFSPQVSASQVAVQFTGTAGKTYVVYRAASPSGPWIRLGTAVTDASTGLGAYQDAAPLASGAFYRVVYE